MDARSNRNAALTGEERTRFINRTPAVLRSDERGWKEAARAFGEKVPVCWPDRNRQQEACRLTENALVEGDLPEELRGAVVGAYRRSLPPNEAKAAEGILDRIAPPPLENEFRPKLPAPPPAAPVPSIGTNYIEGRRRALASGLESVLKSTESCGLNARVLVRRYNTKGEQPSFRDAFCLGVDALKESWGNVLSTMIGEEERDAILALKTPHDRRIRVNAWVNEHYDLDRLGTGPFAPAFVKEVHAALKASNAEGRFDGLRPQETIKMKW